MSDEPLYPRPAIISFGPINMESDLYAAPLGEPFAQQRPLDATGNPHVEYAFTSTQGDTLFSINTGDDALVNFPTWYVMPNGGTIAYRLQYTLSRGGERPDVDFTMDAKGEHRAKLYQDGNSTTFNGEPLMVLPEAEKNELLAASLRGEITFIDLPQERYIERAHRLPDGEYLLVSTHSGQSSLGSVRLFRGSDLQNLREIPVLHIQDFPNNGTTSYTTAEGTLHSSVPYTYPAVATWTLEESTNPIGLTLEHPDRIAQQIVRDTRLIGTPTWEEYSAAQQVSSYNLNMQKSLDQFLSSSTDVGGSTLPGKARDTSGVNLPS